ncbi:MAG: hypothetical protein OEU86_04015 [Gammaproteobacteria bacterium]|nr:hypothetical protein [Gammaproteobacteria bacterium]
MNRLIILCALLVLGGYALAAAIEDQSERQLKLRPGMGGVINIAVEDCAVFSDMHYNGPTGIQHNVLTWLQGYVYAKTGSDIEARLKELPADNGWDFDSLSAVIVDYCAANPEAKVSEAAISLWTVLGEGKSAPQ